jgi:hypothetical protein
MTLFILNVANKPFMLSVVMLNVVAASIRLIGDLLSWFGYWPKLCLHALIVLLRLQVQFEKMETIPT